jgi:hypothetical protein
MVYENAKLNVIIKQAVIIASIKLIPLFLVWTWEIDLYRDLAIGSSIFLVYCIYLWFNGTDFNSVYVDLTESIENDENRTPFEHLLATYGIL